MKDKKVWKVEFDKVWPGLGEAPFRVAVEDNEDSQYDTVTIGLKSTTFSVTLRKDEKRLEMIRLLKEMAGGLTEAAEFLGGMKVKERG